MPSSARCTSSRQPPSQRQRKEKQFNAMTTPTRSAPSATGRQLQKSQKAIACPKVRQNRRLHRYADPRRARRATAPERAQAAFSFGPCTARFLFRKTEKKMGGASRWTSPPVGAESPEAAVMAAHFMSSPLVAAPHQIVDGDPKVVRQLPGVFQIREICPSFKPLIM